MWQCTMDDSAVSRFASRTAQDILDNLEKSLQILVVLNEGLTPSPSSTSMLTMASATTTSTTTPTSGGEGVKKFESLCRGIVSSVQVIFLLLLLASSLKLLDLLVLKYLAVQVLQACKSEII